MIHIVTRNREEESTCEIAGRSKDEAWASDTLLLTEK